jgi:hypothetical protein
MALFVALRGARIVRVHPVHQPLDCSRCVLAGQVSDFAGYTNATAWISRFSFLERHGLLSLQSVMHRLARYVDRRL